MLKQKTLDFWTNWLVTVAAISGIFGILIAVTSLGTAALTMAIAWSPADPPAASAAGDNLMRFVMGIAVGAMLGWSIALGGIAHYAFRHGERWAWIITAASILTWFVVDSYMSAVTGLYANIFGNIAFLILFEIPLVATYNTMVRWPKEASEATA